ncbi:MAG: hypothetical protein ACYC5V_13860 [Gemmatimonadaceae bacterium]
MPSFGEAEVVVNSTIVGRIRITALYADPALYPRLVLKVSVGLRDVAPSVMQGVPQLQNYALTDLYGELRLGPAQEAVGPLSWCGDRRSIQSSGTGAETVVTCSCDLDAARLEQIERRRNGAAPRFFITLWPVLVSSEGRLHCQVPNIELLVPRETWLDFLRAAGSSEFEVLEVQYGPAEREYFKRGLAFVREAREKVGAGEYDDAVGLCRKVLEAAGHEHEAGKGIDALKALLERSASGKRGGEYAGIVTKLKQLAVDAHHDFGAPMTYSRAEAQFIIRVTESLLSLAAHFAAKAPPPTTPPG